MIVLTKFKLRMHAARCMLARDLVHMQREFRIKIYWDCSYEGGDGRAGLGRFHLSSQGGIQDLGSCKGHQYGFSIPPPDIARHKSYSRLKMGEKVHISYISYIWYISYILREFQNRVFISIFILIVLESAKYFSEYTAVSRLKNTKS